MRVEIQALSGGEFKAIGLGWAQCGRGFEPREVIDVEVHAWPGKDGGSEFVLTDHSANLGQHRGSSPMSPEEMVASFKERFEALR
jgi:hypothetical protein